MTPTRLQSDGLLADISLQSAAAPLPSPSGTLFICFVDNSTSSKSSSSLPFVHFYLFYCIATYADTHQNLETTSFVSVIVATLLDFLVSLEDSNLLCIVLI